MSVTVEVLHVRDCPNLGPLLARLRKVTDLPVTTREVATAEDAAATGMNGSPTLLINGHDPFPTPAGDPGVSCRIYRDENGRGVPVPTLAQLRDALTTSPSARSQDRPAAGTVHPAGVLRAWRTRALPNDPVEKTVHHAILRAFAATGEPPALSDLEPIIAGSIRGTASVLAALHDRDANRLAPNGQIAVAYPFSTAPTRHRVRVGRTDAYAMCAIDALGIAAMLGQDTRIDSLDPTTGNPVTVTTTAGNARWDPPEAVVFLSAEAGSGGLRRTAAASTSTSSPTRTAPEPGRRLTPTSPARSSLIQTPKPWVRSCSARCLPADGVLPNGMSTPGTNHQCNAVTGQPAPFPVVDPPVDPATADDADEALVATFSTWRAGRGL